MSPRIEWGDIEDEVEVEIEEGIEEPVYLDSAWTFWYDMYPGPGLTAEQYADAMKKIATVNTIQVSFILKMDHSNVLGFLGNL